MKTLHIISDYSICALLAIIILVSTIISLFQNPLNTIIRIILCIGVVYGGFKLMEFGLQKS